MFAGEQRFLRDLKMRGYRGDDRERLEIRIGEKPSVISRAPHRGITPRHRCQTRFVQVTDPTQFRCFILREVPQQVRPPIAAANNSNRSRAHKTQKDNDQLTKVKEAYSILMNSGVIKCESRHESCQNRER